MNIINTKHNSNSSESISNHSFNKKIVKELRQKITKYSKGGRPEVVTRHQERGKLLARDRIEELIDSDTYTLRRITGRDRNKSWGDK